MAFRAGSAHRRSPHGCRGVVSTRFVLVVVALAAASGLVGLLAAAASEETDLLLSHVRGPVRVWVVVYRSHDGRRHRAYLDLPRWYGPGHDPPIALVISPHGRQARAGWNSGLWGNLPARGDFAVVNPEGQGRVLGNESWGYPGQISDLARMPMLLRRALPWLRLDRHRVYAVGGSMGGQEALLLLARYPRLLAGVAAFDAPTDLAGRYYALARLTNGAYLQQLMRRELGATPAAAPRLYRARSPLRFAAQIASSHVPVELWWSRRDKVVVDQADQSGRLYRLIKTLNPQAPIKQVVGNWPHMAAMNWRSDLPAALRWLGLLTPTPVRRRPAPPATAPGARSPAVLRSSSMAHDSPCDHPKPSPLAYHYPIKPFNRQHPIRGNFGDPRTLSSEQLGADKPGSPGSFTFHNGIDITAATGTRVYPVVSGIAHQGSGDLVTVTTNDRRTFQYFHIKPAVQTGQPVTAYRTVLGTVRPKWQHIHLTEIDHFRTHNPLDPGHLEPYHDHTIPDVDQLTFSTDTGARLDPDKLHGSVLIAAATDDLPAIPVPGHWLDFPVTPALTAWRLTSKTGTIVPETTVADFRHSEPRNRAFWHIYAAGTYQNFPIFAHHDYFHHAGHYLFNLTPTPLNTRQLPNGTYHITVNVADVCGNRSSLTEHVQISNPSRPNPERRWPA
jgi:poly(3-hydroxybutyrate) depolymerase